MTEARSCYLEMDRRFHIFGPTVKMKPLLSAINPAWLPIVNAHSMRASVWVPGLMGQETSWERDCKKTAEARRNYHRIHLLEVERKWTDTNKLL